jgi:hypothetical protein
MNKRKLWTGELAKPIRLRVNRPHGFAVPDRDRDPDANAKIVAENELINRQLAEDLAQEQMKKLKLLFDHFGLAVDDWKGLSLELAQISVPGFRVLSNAISTGGVIIGIEKEHGRPVEWDANRLDELLAAVESIKAKFDLTNREAIARLAGTKKWGPPPTHRGHPDQWLETLESRHHDAKRLWKRASELEDQLREIQRKIFAVDEAENSGNSSGDC